MLILEEKACVKGRKQEVEQEWVEMWQSKIGK